MNKILEIKFGSHLYGTETPQSDNDFKGIYLPSAREIVLGNYKKTISTCRPKRECERNNKDDVDVEIFSLDRFLELLTDGQTVALDLLFCTPKSIVHITDIGSEIMYQIGVNRNKLLSRNINAFVGYSKQQAARYGIKGSRMDALKRTAEYLESCDDQRKKLEHYSAHFANLVDECASLISLEKTPLVEILMLKGPKGLVDQPHLKVNGRHIPFHATVKYAKEIVGKMLEGYGQRAKKAHLASGIDWKALSHAVRIGNEALELLNTGKITFPRPERELLVKIKLGQLPYEQVAEMIEEGLAKLYEAHEENKAGLLYKPDMDYCEDLIYNIYSEIVRKGSYERY